jgi:hypothetical protein
MTKTPPTAEQVAEMMFRAQGRMDIDPAYSHEDVLQFVQNVGALVAYEKRQDIMARLTWTETLQDIEADLKSR